MEPRLQIENCTFGGPSLLVKEGVSCAFLTCGFNVSRPRREVSRECSFCLARSERDFPDARDMPKVDATSRCGSSCRQHCSTYLRREVGSVRTAFLTSSIDWPRISACSRLISVTLFAVCVETDF